MYRMTRLMTSTWLKSNTMVVVLLKALQQLLASAVSKFSSIIRPRSSSLAAFEVNVTSETEQQRAERASMQFPLNMAVIFRGGPIESC